MPIHFSAREMQRAWKNNLKAYEQANNTSSNIRTNAHRLLLFYSIECGLKAALMKDQSVNYTQECDQVRQCSHNINKLLDALRAGHNLKISSKIVMQAKNGSERSLNSGEINQMWRYGGEATHTQNGQGNLVDLSDEDLEKQLLKISIWIREVLHS